MNGPNSWEVDSYQEGKWRISVRHNLENDRMDEGDFPETSSKGDPSVDSKDHSYGNTFKLK
jgi:hypothetical protein